MGFNGTAWYIFNEVWWTWFPKNEHWQICVSFAEATSMMFRSPLIKNKSIRTTKKERHETLTTYRNEGMSTHTRSLIRTKHLYMSYVSYCYHFCYSVWQQLKRESVCVLLEQKAKLCSAVWPSGDTVHMLLFVPSREAGHPSLSHLLFCSACLSSDAV